MSGVPLSLTDLIWSISGKFGWLSRIQTISYFNSIIVRFYCEILIVADTAISSPVITVLRLGTDETIAVLRRNRLR